MTEFYDAVIYQIDGKDYPFRVYASGRVTKETGEEVCAEGAHDCLAAYVQTNILDQIALFENKETVAEGVHSTVNFKVWMITILCVVMASLIVSYAFKKYENAKMNKRTEKLRETLLGGESK